MILPNVVIAGAPKCGTTSIFEWLSDHPDVCVSSTKETGYFIAPRGGAPDELGSRQERGLEAYGRFFAHCGKRPGVKVILEATPDYFDQETAIAAVPSLPSAPIIVFILRKPSMRIYSAFQFSRNNLSTLPKGMTFKEFVGLSPVSDGAPATTVLRLTLDQTHYARHISRWIASAGRDRVCLFLFEDLLRDQAGFMRRLSARIGIAPAFWDDYDFRRMNASYRVRSQNLQRLVRRLTAAAPSLVRSDRLKRLYGLMNKQKTAGISAEDAVIMAGLDERFQPFNDELAQVGGIDLSCWK